MLKELPLTYYLLLRKFPSLCTKSIGGLKAVPYRYSTVLFLSLSSAFGLDGRCCFGTNRQTTQMVGVVHVHHACHVRSTSGIVASGTFKSQLSAVRTSGLHSENPRLGGNCPSSRRSRVLVCPMRSNGKRPVHTSYIA
jgi:hypothetical protein